MTRSFESFATLTTIASLLMAALPWVALSFVGGHI
jgi:hypothetical protein